MNKYEATDWMYKQGVGSKVRDNFGQVWTLLKDGCVVGDRDGNYYGLPSPQQPFTPVLPKKSNEELARECMIFWSNDQVGSMFKFLLDCMDEKIREAK